MRTNEIPEDTTDYLPDQGRQMDGCEWILLSAMPL